MISMTTKFYIDRADWEKADRIWGRTKRCTEFGEFDKSTDAKAKLREIYDNFAGMDVLGLSWLQYGDEWPRIEWYDATGLHCMGIAYTMK